MLCDGCNKDFNEKDLIEYNPKTFLCKDCLTFIQYHIHSNSYRPNNFGLTKDRNGLYIGVTFCIGTDKFSNFYNLLKTYSKDYYFYFKNYPYAINICSYPLNIQSKLFKDVFERLYFHLHKNHIIDIEDMPMHIHLDKEYFKQNEIAKIDYIINNYYDVIERYTGWHYHYDNPYCKIVSKSSDKWGCNSENKNVACNINNNTVELRFFNTAFDYNTFLKRIDAVLKIIELAKRFSWISITSFTTCQLNDWFTN